jgi:tellurite methyltransferase
MMLPDISIKQLNHLLGNIDIYLLDQILKRRFPKNYKILDAGCGEGRNLIYFIRNNYKVYGIDKNIDSINMLKHLSKSVNPNYPRDRFLAGNVREMPFKNAEFGAIISSAVLHFSEDESEFKEQFAELLRILKPGGILFVRMATIIGIEHSVKFLENGKYLQPDGSVRFLLTSELLRDIKNQMDLIEPFKVVLVDNQRCMSTMVLKKPEFQREFNIGC